MVGPKVDVTSRPSLLDGITMLPPGAQVVAGTSMLLLAAGTLLLGSLWGLLFLAVGAPVVIAGVAARRQAHADREQRARAELELPELRVVIAAAVAARHNVSRLLRLRGYTSAKVRRWIALECDVVLARGD